MATKKNRRDTRGRFLNCPGPGRPARPVERDYIATIRDCVTLEDWRRIAVRAKQDAEAGDAKAREWLAKYLLGDTPLSLSELEKLERLGITSDVEIDAQIDKEINPDPLDTDSFLNPSIIQRAMNRVVRNGEGNGEI